jgi:hypothetical protein
MGGKNEEKLNIFKHIKYIFYKTKSIDRPHSKIILLHCSDFFSLIVIKICLHQNIYQPKLMDSLFYIERIDAMMLLFSKSIHATLKHMPGANKKSLH